MLIKSVSKSDDDDVYFSLFDKNGIYSYKLLIEFCVKTLIEFVGVPKNYVLYTKNLLLKYCKVNNKVKSKLLLKNDDENNNYNSIIACLNLQDDVIGLALGHINDNYFLEVVFTHNSEDNKDEDNKDEDNKNNVSIRFSEKVFVTLKSYVLLDDLPDSEVKFLENIKIIRNSGILTIGKITYNLGIYKYISNWLTNLPQEINFKLYMDLKERICSLTLEKYLTDNITISRINETVSFLDENLKEIRKKINNSFILDLNKHLKQY